MKWTISDDGWRKRFSIIPVCVSDGPTKHCIWLEWYWSRHCGDCREVSFTDPNAVSSPKAKPVQRDPQTFKPGKCAECGGINGRPVYCNHCLIRTNHAQEADK